MYPLIERELFNIDKPYAQINFPEDGGVTGYYSRNITKTDLNLIREFCSSKSIEILNTRSFKDDKGVITVTVGSISSEGSESNITFKDQ